MSISSRALSVLLTQVMSVALAALGTALPASAQETAEITLEEAIRRALLVQPTMIEAQGQRRTAGAAARSAWGAFLPSLSASSSASRSNVDRVDLTTGRTIPAEFSYTLGISANLGLFEGFQRLADRKAAAAGVEAADAGLRGARFQVTFDTKQIFYDSAAREQLVRVAEAQLARAEQQLEVTTNKLRAGSATRSDSLRAQVEVGNARIALLEAQANLATAKADLGRQVGADEPVRALADTTLPDFPDTTLLRQAVLETAPSVVQVEAEARAAKAQVTAARADYWPSISMGVNETRQGTGSPFSNLDDYERTSSLRFALSWTLFNGFVREANQIQASVRRDVAEAQAVDVRREVGAQITQYLSALSTAHAQIDIAVANVAAATEDFRVQNDRYRVGAATSLDISASQANLVEAEVNLVQARFNYLTARAQLEALIGSEL